MSATGTTKVPDRRLAGVLACACALLALVPAALARPRGSALSSEEQALSRSRDLWATIDVCGPSGAPNTVGVRGSMPGDGHSHDKMYMSFHLQYMTTGKHWENVVTPGTGWAFVGTANIARQEGTSFALKPAPGGKPYVLRGLVEFQWRWDGHVASALSEPTSAGHGSVVENADPRGYSAAVCALS